MTERSNPLYVLTLWYKPGQTMQGLIANSASGQGHRVALVVAMTFGMLQSGRAYIAAEGEGTGILTIGVFAGLIGLFLFAWLLRNFGRWFGAQASLREVRTALGLGLLPWTVLFAILIYAMSQVDDAAAIQRVGLLFFAGFVYGYVVLLLSLAAALRLSVWKTFFCIVVTFLVSLFPLTLVLQMISGAAQ